MLCYCTSIQLPWSPLKHELEAPVYRAKMNICHQCSMPVWSSNLDSVCDWKCRNLQNKICNLLRGLTGGGRETRQSMMNVCENINDNYCSHSLGFVEKHIIRY